MRGAVDGQVLIPGRVIPVLFVTDLAYGSVPSIGVDPAKIAILAASLAAGLLGAAVLFRARASSPS